jgi:sortase A
MAARALRSMAVVLAGSLLAACTGESGAGRPAPSSPTDPRAGAGSARASATPSEVPPPSAATPSSPAPSPPSASDGRPRRALLSVPAVGVRDVAVVPYRGRTDDAPGSRLQDRGVAASPHGPQGGTGPGGIGNYQVTAHRTSSTRAFARLPELRPGDRVQVRTGRVVHVYEIRRTRWTSFRSQRSLAAQRAAVPGRPGATPTRAFITLSTCATPEDHAAGNFWADRFHNPEHRIDKVGVLVRRVVRPG